MVGFIPIPWLCFQVGTTQNPCRCKVVGPTLAFAVAIVAAVICYPASIFCGCWCTETGSKVLSMPVEINGIVSNAIPI